MVDVVIDSVEKLHALAKVCRETGTQDNFITFALEHMRLPQSDVNLMEGRDVAKEVFPEMNSENMKRVNTILNLWEKSSGFNSVDTAFIMGMLLNFRNRINELEAVIADTKTGLNQIGD